MANEFSDHHYWAIILGGSSGLGLAAAQKLAAHGMNLCIVHRDPGVEMERVNAAFEAIRKEGVEVISFNADVTRADKRVQILEQLESRMGVGGKVRCLVHSIARGTLKAMVEEEVSGGIGREQAKGIVDGEQVGGSTGRDQVNGITDKEKLSSIDDKEKPFASTLSTDDFRITLDSMAYSLYDWVKDLSFRRLFAADARVLSFTSEGSHRAWKHYAAVSAAKAALEAISRNIALEFAPLGIRANCIQAGTTNTRSLQLIPGSDQLIAWSEARNPFQRLTTPEDVANVVYLLCKDEAGWINGAIIPVDGGAHIC